MYKVVNSNGQVIASYTYDAWGKVIAITNTAGDEQPNIAGINPIRYRGYYYDSETGMYYLNSRYYDPETGRFINADDTDYLGASGTVLGYNLFAYCENNPVNCSDPSGHKRKSFNRDWAGVSLDVIFSLLCPHATWVYDLVGGMLKETFRRNGRRVASEYLLSRVLPKVTNAFLKVRRFIYLATYKVLGTGCLIAESYIGARFIARLGDGAYGKKSESTYYFISMFFSTGALIAGLLDYTTDGLMDGKITVNI